MAKNLKLKIKNTQIAAAVSLGRLKDKLTEKVAPEKAPAKAKAPSARAKAKPEVQQPEAELPKERAAPRPRARSRSAFAEPSPTTPSAIVEEQPEELAAPPLPEEPEVTAVEETLPEPVEVEAPIEELQAAEVSIEEEELTPFIPEPVMPVQAAPEAAPKAKPGPREKLGPTGRHVRDLLPPVKATEKAAPAAVAPAKKAAPAPEEAAKAKTKAKTSEVVPATSHETEEAQGKKAGKGGRFKEFQDLKPARFEGPRAFDGRDRQGLRDTEEESRWRGRRRGKPMRAVQEAPPVRPTELTIRLPISIKDLAVEMKLKASQLIEKFFLQGTVCTINDLLTDETAVQLLGQEFGCEITIDTREERRIRITDKSVKDEITQSKANLAPRPPVVTFMGHVDHGKTSLIDAIRKSNRAAGEAGAITQHIGAFQCHTAVGDITILDTPGHEAFSAMRARGADITDIVVLVIAGDEGIRPQTLEAIEHAKGARVTIVIAINKSDKPNFNAENVYRQLTEVELVPEVWGGQTITVNCSAATGEGVSTLLEMLALQSEVLELRADVTARARGRVIESELHKGQGLTATVLVQNGTLRRGDALVFDQHWGRVKTMRDDLGRNIEAAPPSAPVTITGLSGLPEAGQEFIVVASEREARDIAEKRSLGIQQHRLQQRQRVSVENMVQQASEAGRKVLNLVIRADVQGSLEALQNSLRKIQSDKATLNIIFSGVGEVSESDVQLASASKAVILGFHSGIESHADTLVKELGVQVRLHDIIYHALDDIKALMAELLDRIPQETEKGKTEVLALFKSSQYGTIAGCKVVEGSVARNHYMRVKRGEEIIWKGGIASLKRVKEDVKEVTKGFECGIVLQGFPDVQVGDILESYEITYITQQL